VLEAAFDAVQLSNRHESGVAMRFPRLARIRTDKPSTEANRLETLMALIADHTVPILPGPTGRSARTMSLSKEADRVRRSVRNRGEADIKFGRSECLQQPLEILRRPNQTVRKSIGQERIDATCPTGRMPYSRPAPASVPSAAAKLRGPSVRARSLEQELRQKLRSNSEAEVISARLSKAVGDTPSPRPSRPQVCWCLQGRYFLDPVHLEGSRPIAHIRAN
jgi:hypothetical protein